MISPATRQRLIVSGPLGGHFATLHEAANHLAEKHGIELNTDDNGDPLIFDVFSCISPHAILIATEQWISYTVPASRLKYIKIEIQNPIYFF